MKSSKSFPTKKRNISLHVFKHRKRGICSLKLSTVLSSNNQVVFTSYFTCIESEKIDLYQLIKKFLSLNLICNSNKVNVWKFSITEQHHVLKIRNTSPHLRRNLNGCQLQCVVSNPWSIFHQTVKVCQKLFKKLHIPLNTFSNLRRQMKILKYSMDKSYKHCRLQFIIFGTFRHSYDTLMCSKVRELSLRFKSSANSVIISLWFKIIR